MVSPANARAAREHLVEHAAERPDVRPLVQRLPARLFRAHVRRGAQDSPPRLFPPADWPSVGGAGLLAGTMMPWPGRSRAP